MTSNPLHNASYDSSQPSDPTPFALKWEEADGRTRPEERFALYRLCECEHCWGVGHLRNWFDHSEKKRCAYCKGEGRELELVATCPTPAALGVALVTLAREQEFSECPIGVLDRMGEVGQKWLVKPWLPSPRNASDAGRLLRSRREDVKT